MDECYLYSHEQCEISFCLFEVRAGFSCCSADVSASALEEAKAALGGLQSTSDEFMLVDFDGFQTAEEHSDNYHGSVAYLEATQNMRENHGDEVAFAEPCESMAISPTRIVTPTATPTSSATPTPSATPPITSSPTSTRTPSISPSPTTTPSVSPSPSPKFATLHYAADNEAFVYVNGNLISALTDWRLFETTSFPLKRNDVVAILGRDNGGWFGLIAALQVGDRWFVTGRDEWKAIKAFEFPGNDDLWTFPFFNTCSWDIVEARPNADVAFNGKALDFPYETGAQYVWADDAGENDSIYVRFVLGGEDCS
ncbi:unnamed protein product [Agarophyton chilense]